MYVHFHKWKMYVQNDDRVIAPAWNWQLLQLFYDLCSTSALTTLATVYMRTADNLLSYKVRVIKWHINIKAYNMVTLSFIALINP